MRHGKVVINTADCVDVWPLQTDAYSDQNTTKCKYIQYHFRWYSKYVPKIANIVRPDCSTLRYRIRDEENMSY